MTDNLDTALAQAEAATDAAELALQEAAAEQCAASCEDVNGRRSARGVHADAALARAQQALREARLAERAERAAFRAMF
jgi:hypothetical protein